MEQSGDEIEQLIRMYNWLETYKSAVGERGITVKEQAAPNPL
jgi:hypothetical protein